MGVELHNNKIASYSERAARLALNASIAVQVLMGSHGDLEFVSLKPRAADEDMWSELKDRWPGRGLRDVGIIGLVDASPCYALKERLEPEQVSALAGAFLAYLHVYFHDSFAAQIEAAEIAELERMFALEDPRTGA